MFYVYILHSVKFAKSYVGHTHDVKRRLIEHNLKKSNFTSKYAPWYVIYTESFDTKAEAIKREKYLKSAAGRRWMKKHVNWPRGATE